MALLEDEKPPASAGARSPLRAILPYTTVLTILVALYVAWIFYSRHEEAQRAEQAAQEQKTAAEKRVNDQIFGSGEVTFTTFEASSASLRPGESTELCYGVVNAKAVKIDPPIEQLRPTSRHCMEVAPRKTTTYTITADDGAGHSKTLSLTIRVR
jgi:hypothetical protein